MKIPNSAFTYSSSYSRNQGYYARLNDRGWYPTATDELATLKIGFQPEKRKITAIALQSGGGYVSTYELYYSPDGLSVEPWIDNALAKVRLGTPLHKSNYFTDRFPVSVGLMITNDVNIGWEFFFWPKCDILYKTVQVHDEMELIYTGIVSREVVREGD